MNKKALIIFMKNPVKGQVKTRLARSVGDDTALAVYRRLLDHSRKVAAATAAKRCLFYSDFVDSKDEWAEELFEKHLQTGNDLGERMHNAFQTIFDSDVERAVIIGTDCFELTTSVLELAFDALNDADVVIGPATDGGYYLLGLKAPQPELFTDKSWSTGEVMKQTLTSIASLDLSVVLLNMLADVDTEADLQNYSQLTENINRFIK